MKQNRGSEKINFKIVLLMLGLEILGGPAFAQAPQQALLPPSANQEPIVVHFDQHSDMGIFSTRKRGFPGMWEEDELQVQNNLVSPVRKLSPEVNINDLEPVGPEQD